MIKNDNLFTNEEIKTFYKDLIKIRKRGNITGNLLSPFRSRKYEKWEREYLDIADNENSKFAARLSINNKIFHSLFYKKTSTSCSYIIMFKFHDSNPNFGKVLEYFEYKSKYYASVLKFNVMSNDFQSVNHMFDFKNASTLNEFFFLKIDELTKIIIGVENIIANAIEININEKTYITYMQEDDEHD